MQLSMTLEEELRDAIIGKIVERVGERVYLETWARDVAKVTRRIDRHISEALQRDGEYGNKARKEFANFLEALRGVINPSITEEDARSMLVQHIVTSPIFDALFGEYEFLKKNPVAISFDHISEVFETFVRRETQTLDSFYRLVEIRAKGIDKEAERQDFLRQLYDSFFKLAFPKTSDSLGIVYTPVEVVDFLVRSADAALKNEFGLSLADEDVVILEPFTGTGTFLSRLMHFLPKEALERKYQSNEIWGNEILLLPYYIALANVESAYYERTNKHEPFKNMLLVDSFQMAEENGPSQLKMFPEQYTEMMKKQKQAKVNVIISNPPWYSRQEYENLGAKATKYDNLDNHIRETYAKDSSATLVNTLYDGYIRAIRLATNRIEEKGVIAFVTNSGFLDGNAADGLRKHLENDFAKIYILNLRGNARLAGEARKKEGGNIFEQGSRAGVVLLILVKDKDQRGPATIYYHDIGDYLSREDKLLRLKNYGDIRSVNWKQIKPNESYDWINKRSNVYSMFPPIALKRNKKDQNKTQNQIFKLHSLGINTAQDTRVYNFSKFYLMDNINLMTDEYNKAIEEYHSNKSYRNVDEFIQNSTYKVKWGRTQKRKLEQGQKSSFDTKKIVCSLYRPYIKQWLYYDSDRIFNNEIYQIPNIYPESEIDNIAITIQAPGSNKPFSTLMVKLVLDYHLLGDTQTFSLYTYEPLDENHGMFDTVGDEKIFTAPSGKKYIRRDNITDWALREYRERYGKDVTKKDIFYYVYGLLHSSDYRDRFKFNLRKELSRIPFVKSADDFHAFSDAGRKLADLHLNYETIEPWLLTEEITDDSLDEFDLYKVQKMRFGRTSDRRNDKTVIIYNDHITLRDIPLEAYKYMVNGKSAIEWIMERYQVKQDSRSGIINDPNKWLEEQDDPRYIVDLIKRIVRVSIETVNIMDSLPKLDVEDPSLEKAGV